MLLDVRGSTIEELPFGSQDGELDIFSVPVAWLKTKSARILLTMRDADGSPYFADPRNIVERLTHSLNELGLYPVIALELEFYLLESASGLTPKLKVSKVPGTVACKPPLISSTHD